MNLKKVKKILPKAQFSLDVSASVKRFPENFKKSGEAEEHVVLTGFGSILVNFNFSMIKVALNTFQDMS